jgi:ADP-heptose:LPS heptosyltransferase
VPIKAFLRHLLLLPLQPHIVRAEIRALRMLRLLPQRIPGEWPPRRILIVNITGNLGDALMMLPTVDALRRALPHAAIDLVVESPMDLPLRSAPAFRSVYRFKSRKSAIPLLSHYLRALDIFRLVRRFLMDQPYDLALLPRWGTDPGLSTYVAAMSSAPRRGGHDPADEAAGEDFFPGMTTLLTDISHGGLGMAEGVREQLVLVACGIISTFDDKVEEIRPVETVLAMSDTVDVDSSMRRLGIPLNQPFLLLAPGASHPARRWPPEQFAALGVALRKNLNVPVFLIGGPVDQELGKQIQQLSEGLVHNLAGQTSVLEGIALTRRASLLVTNDSGPAHIGGSVGIPTLVLSVCPRTSTQEHPNSPLRVRPVGPRVVVMQPESSSEGCTDRCLREEAHCILGLSTDAVLAQATQMLSPVELANRELGD